MTAAHALLQWATDPPGTPGTNDNAGTLGFLIFLALIAASVGIFYGMRHSLRRLREHSDGDHWTDDPADRTQDREAHRR